MLASTRECWTGELLNKFCPLCSPNKPLLIVAKEIIIGPLDLKSKIYQTCLDVLLQISNSEFCSENFATDFGNRLKKFRCS